MQSFHYKNRFITSTLYKNWEVEDEDEDEHPLNYLTQWLFILVIISLPLNKELCSLINLITKEELI